MPAIFDSTQLIVASETANKIRASRIILLTEKSSVIKNGFIKHSTFFCHQNDILSTFLSVLIEGSDFLKLHINFRLFNCRFLTFEENKI